MNRVIFFSFCKVGHWPQPQWRFHGLFEEITISPKSKSQLDYKAFTKTGPEMEHEEPKWMPVKILMSGVAVCYQHSQK